MFCNFVKTKIMDYKNFIVRNPEIMMGKPSIIGTRISVELIMQKVAGGFTVDELLKSYPFLTHDQINAAFHYTAGHNPEKNQ